MLATTSGSSTTLESLETSFQQDLNGDGTIGIPPPTHAVAQVVSAAPAGFTVADTFAFRPGLGGAGADSVAPAVSPAAGEILTLSTAAAPVPHIDVADVHDLGGMPGAVESAVFDQLHGFIIH